MGPGPEDIYSFLIGNLLVVRLKGVLTAAEQQLAKNVSHAPIPFLSYCFCGPALTDSSPCVDLEVIILAIYIAMKSPQQWFPVRAGRSRYFEVLARVTGPDAGPENCKTGSLTAGVGRRRLLGAASSRHLEPPDVSDGEGSPSGSPLGRRDATGKGGPRSQRLAGDHQATTFDGPLRS